MSARLSIPRVITDPVLVTFIYDLMAGEMATCPTCKFAPSPQPNHFGTYLRQDAFYQKPCASNNRVFDPTTRDFVGYAHCICASCF